MIFEWFSWFPSFLLLIFNLWLTFQEIWSKWGKSNKTLICFWITFFRCNVYPQCNSMILSGLVDSLSFLLLIFQFVTNISGDMIEMRKNHTYMLLNHFSKVVMYFRNAILWFLSGLVDSLSFLLLIFNLWLTFQEIWSKWGKSNKNTYMLLNHFFKGCNAYPQCNSMIFEWFSWFPIIPVTNFQFVTNISGDMIEMRKIK